LLTIDADSPPHAKQNKQVTKKLEDGYWFINIAAPQVAAHPCI